MVLCRKVIIFTGECSNPIQIKIDLPRAQPQRHIEEFLHYTYCNLLPRSGWVPRARIRHFGSETHFELLDRVWLLSGNKGKPIE